MKKALIVLIITVAAPFRIFAQVGINSERRTPDAPAMLDVNR